MKKALQHILFVAALLPGTAFAEPVGQAASSKAQVVKADPLPMMTLDEAVAATHGKLSLRVLAFLKTMNGIVAAGKQPDFTEARWNALTPMVDVDHFRRVGNFGEVMNWKDYTPMLTKWVQHSWWQGRIRRISEVGNLVYLEAEERMSTKGEVRDDGGYDILHSLSVYEFGKDGKLTGLWVYDERPR